MSRSRLNSSNEPIDDLRKSAKLKKFAKNEHSSHLIIIWPKDPFYNNMIKRDILL